VSGWEHSGTWTGNGLRREVFFFASAGVAIYGSLYMATEISRPFGVVACNSWGVEADRCDPLQRTVALEMARLGGAGLIFHYPGYGDSYGELSEVGLDVLRDAAVDAVAEGSRRCPGLTWTLAGFMFGAVVASLAGRPAAVERLLLVQPSLRPAEYFRAVLGRRGLTTSAADLHTLEFGAAPGMAYGYPVPERILAAGAAAERAPVAALASFASGGAVVRHREPASRDVALEGFEQVEAPGTWRFGSQNHPELAAAAVEWLERSTRA
jgi:hypothetical protein